LNINLKIDTRIFNDKYLPFLKSDQYIQIFFGGSSSGKSFFACQRLVLDMLEGGRNYLIVRKCKDSISKSIYNEIIKAIYFFKVEKYFNMPKTEMTITCKINDYQVLFSGLDNVEKVKSISPRKGVVTDILIEEATEIEYSDYKQLRKRLRGLSEKSKRISMLFNPILKTHWIYKELFDEYCEIKKFYQDEYKLIVHSTYKDNKFLGKEEIFDLENEKDPYYRDVYTYGNWGIIGNLILKNWRVEDLSELIPRFDNLADGLDWGLRDPAAYIKTHYEKKRKRMYCWGEIFEPELLNYDFQYLIKKQGYTNELIVADSAEPKDIKEFRETYGFNIIAADKGKGSIDSGLRWLRETEIIIDIKCYNLKRELSTYRWMEDKHGNVLSKPVDKDNHLIDCIRYVGYTLYKEEKAWGWKV
jgi:phage terminase large subunit